MAGPDHPEDESLPEDDSLHFRSLHYPGHFLSPFLWVRELLDALRSLHKSALLCSRLPLPCWWPESEMEHELGSIYASLRFLAQTLDTPVEIDRGPFFPDPIVLPHEVWSVAEKVKCLLEKYPWRDWDPVTGETYTAAEIRFYLRRFADPEFLTAFAGMVEVLESALTEMESVHGTSTVTGTGVPLEKNSTPCEPAPESACQHKKPSTDTDPSQLIDLETMAHLVHRKKRSLEPYKTKGMPAPVAQGGRGQKSLWYWPEVRAWLEQTFHIPNLPARIPSAYDLHRPVNNAES